MEVRRATFILSDTGVIYVTSTQNEKKNDKEVECGTDTTQVREGSGGTKMQRLTGVTGSG